MLILTRFWLFLFLTACIAMPCYAQERFSSKRLDALLKKRGWILIGLADSVSSVEIMAPGGADVIMDGRSETAPPGTISVSRSGGGVQVKLPGQSLSARAGVTISPRGGRFLSYKGRNYRGRLIYRSGTVLNEVMIDDWLKGVLPAEIGSDSPVEALKAQAVAGRSEAIFRLANPPHAASGYDFCTGVHCQAYKGIGEETPEIVRACEDTLGYVMVAGDDVLNAVYHNVCGGVTAGAEEVWDSKPIAGLTPVFDSVNSNRPNFTNEALLRQFLSGSGQDFFCYPGNPGYANYAKKYFRWTKTLSAGEISRATGMSSVQDITVTERMASGRVRRLTLSGSSGSKTYEKELNIRKVFDLWSGLFVVDVERSGGAVTSVTFTGAGNGHGVGLCQHGAREMARRGATFGQILGHYYKGAQLQKIYKP